MKLNNSENNKSFILPQRSAHDLKGQYIYLLVGLNN